MEKEKSNTNNSLFGKTFSELSQIVNELLLPAFTARQIADWLYKKNVSSIDEMTNLSSKNRTQISKTYIIGTSEPLEFQKSKDGVKKYLFLVNEGKYIETVYIPEPLTSPHHRGKPHPNPPHKGGSNVSGRATLCISSQVGCRMGCAFCMTARQGYQSNLTANEILNQFRSLPEHNNLSNIVFMGMGEPFDNKNELMKCLEILTSDWGYAWAPKRITVSTIGILPAIRNFMDKSRCHLAVSLHHPDSAERQKLVPAENKYPIKQIVDTLKTYDLNKQRRISFEYVMLAGVNDSLQQANDTVRLLSGLKCRVNLIGYNDPSDKTQLTPLRGGSGRSLFKPSGEQVIQQFADTLNRKGIITTIRRSRGIDIEAACGMLSTNKIKKQ